MKKCNKCNKQWYRRKSKFEEEEKGALFHATRRCHGGMKVFYDIVPNEFDKTGRKAAGYDGINGMAFK